MWVRRNAKNLFPFLFCHVGCKVAYVVDSWIVVFGRVLSERLIVCYGWSRMRLMASV